MALAYEITPGGDHVQIVGCGAITTEECIGVVKHIMADPRHRADATALIDLRGATYKPADMADVIDIAQTVESFRSLLKNNIAIVADQSLLFPAEIFSSHIRAAANVGIKVFVDLAAAMAFLRLTPEPALRTATPGA